jgi:tripartite-type tricarboxylate transporter receptor subunit TctC
MKNVLSNLKVAIGILCLGLSSQLFAQENYPNRPITFILAVEAGSDGDVLARPLMDRVGRILGQPITIVNRPGAGSAIGYKEINQAKPDGYTIGIVGGSHNINKFLFKQLGWDPEKSFEPIVYTHVVPLVFAIAPQIPAKTLPEFITWMKANPDNAKIATSGRGSAQEMAAEMFKMATKVDMLFVPYKGSSAAHPDLLAGRTALYIDTISAIQSQVKAGNVRAIAVSTIQRTHALPQVPTADEQGLKGYDANTNGGFLAPAGTPKFIIQKLNAEINAALKLPDVKAKLEAAGIDIQGGTPQDYANLIKSDLAKWSKVIKEAGIIPE